MDTAVKKMIAGIAFTGATAVALGAFGSHGLKSIVDESLLLTWKTGVQYQFYHIPLLAIIAWLHAISPRSIYRIAYGITAAGIILFSGSLYLLATRFYLGIEAWTWLGPVTPVGGLMLLIGWGLVFYSTLTHASNSEANR